MEFPQSGPRIAAKDNDGEDIWRLWRIWNKCTLDIADGDLCYEVQYWERYRGQNYVYARPAEEIKSNYPDETDAWEEKYGDAWDAKYGTVGNIWSTNVQATKRPFDDTPDKARKEMKKPKASVTDREVDSGEDEEMQDEDPFLTTPPRRMNQFEIRVPSFRAGVPSVPKANEDVEMSSSVAVSPASVRISRGMQEDDDVSDVPSPLVYRTGASSPMGARLPTSSVGSPTQQPRLLSRSVLREEIGDSEMDDSESLTSNLMIQAGSKHVASRNAEMDDLESLTSKLSIQAAPSNIASSDAAPQSTPAASHASRGLTPERSQSPDQDMDDKLLAMYEKSQLEFAAAGDPETGSESPNGQIDPSQRVIEENQFEEYSQKLIEAYSETVEHLLTAALELTDMPCDDWVTRRKKGSKCDYRDLMSYLVVMLLGMDGLVLEHFVKGDLPKAEKSDAALQKRLRKLRNLGRKEKCPSIYAQYLVDKNGESPCPKVLLEVLEKAELYVRGLGEQDSQSGTFSVEVDSVIGKPWPLTESVAGKRKYIKDEGQAEKCIAWIENVRHRISSLPADQPLERPLAEVGYATTPIERLDQHARHTSSNYLMNLCEAICWVLYGDRYSIAQYVVFHTFHLSHAMYAEIVLSRIGLVYTAQGGGFSHHPAGISHPDANGVGKHYYADVEERLYKDPDFLDRFESHQRKMAELTALYKGWLTLAAKEETLEEEERLVAQALERALEEKAQQKERLEMLKATEPFMKLLQLAKDLGLR